MFRKILFWSHLCCGVIAGLIILMMSVTGVLLTYERQIKAWQEQQEFAEQADGADLMSLDVLVSKASLAKPELPFDMVTLSNHEGARVVFAAGRRGGLTLNPYTGEVVDNTSPALESFFGTVEGLHRWFNLSGESRNTGRAITGASNLMFLFIVISGIYLWFPSIWKWGMFKVRLWFRNTGGNSKARDFNWHHVFGIWAAIPLVFIVATASVFYYPWANALVYRIYGEDAPVRGAAPGPSPGQEMNAQPSVERNVLSMDALLVQISSFVEREYGTWRQITLPIQATSVPTLNVSIDLGNGGQPQLRHNLVVDSVSGEILETRPFSSQSPGRRTRSIIRFLHTGEVLGIIGQTIAGLASLASVFMVWTGLALAWRRLISPLFRRQAG